MTLVKQLLRHRHWQEKTHYPKLDSRNATTLQITSMMLFYLILWLLILTVHQFLPYQKSMTYKHT